MTISINAVAPLLLVTGLVLSTPCAATEASEAIRRCDATPGCTFNVNDDGGLVVRGPTGGIVQCPAKGPCTVVSTVRGGKPKPGAGAPGKVTGVMAPVLSPRTPKPKDAAPAHKVEKSSR